MIRTLVIVIVSVVVGAAVAAGLGTHSARLGGIPIPWLCAALAFGVQWVAFLPAWLMMVHRYGYLT